MNTNNLSLRQLFVSSAQYLQDLLSMAKLETRLALNRITKILCLTVSLVILLLSSWGLIMWAMAYSLMANGLALFLAIVIIAGSNLVLALLCYLYIKILLHKIDLNKTQQQLSKIMLKENGYEPHNQTTN